MFLSSVSSSFGQTDSSNIPITTVVIDDSASVQDSVNAVNSKSSFNPHPKTILDRTGLASFSLTKNKINYSNYNYSGEVLFSLPFTSLLNFGYTGAPSEPKIFSFGYGNNSVILDGIALNNKWSNTSDLNVVQTEDIYSLKIVPLSRSFLYGNNNNQSAIMIETRDSIKSKPISRIRYYQAPNDEGFIDAMFSAKVLSRLSFAFRITSISSNGDLSNTEYGSWKANVKSIYRLSDKIYTKVDYYHIKSDVELYSGINVNNTTSPNSIDIFDQFAPINFNDRYKQTTIHNLSTSIYGEIFDDNFSQLKIGQNYYSDKFKQNYDNAITDSTRINNENKSTTYFARLTSEQQIGNLKLKFSSGYESVDLNVEDINYNNQFCNYYTWAMAQYGLLNNTITPTVFGKYSSVDSQDFIGFGSDISFEISKRLKVFVGGSNFQKPYSILERQTLPIEYQNLTQKFSSFFATIEYNTPMVLGSISLFNSNSTNSPIAIFNNSDFTLNSNQIIFNNVKDLNKSGANLFLNSKFWNMLTTVNLNYYWEEDNFSESVTSNYNLTAGIYYVDTLYSSNLFLKTGLTFYLFDEANYELYDYQKLRSAGYYLNNNKSIQFNSLGISNSPYRLDFFLSGRIQDLATFFFVFENILANDYFTIPYYPMPEGGIKIGISWDFLD